MPTKSAPFYDRAGEKDLKESQSWADQCFKWLEHLPTLKGCRFSGLMPGPGHTAGLQVGSLSLAGAHVGGCWTCAVVVLGRLLLMHPGPPAGCGRCPSCVLISMSCWGLLLSEHYSAGHQYCRLVPGSVLIQSEPPFPPMCQETEFLL